MKHRVRMILTILGSLAALSVFMIAFQFIQSSGVATGQSVPATGGLKMTVTGVTINSSNIPEVSFTLADAKGSPLKIADLDANAIRFDIVVQKLNADSGAIPIGRPMSRRR